MAAKTTIIGLPQLDAILKAKAAALQAAATVAVATEVERVKGDAVQGAPRGASGELADGIESESQGTGGEVRTTARHSGFQEFGTSRHPAQPYMAPAADRARSRFTGRVTAAVRRAVT